MKCVMDQDQVVHITDHIDALTGITPESDEGMITLSRELLTCEHSDGLNFIHLELARYDRIARIVSLRSEIVSTESLAVWMLMPRTACRVQAKPLSDEYNVSGYGIMAKAGSGLVLFCHALVAFELKGGHIGLPDVRTSSDRRGRAKQRFWTTEGNILFGGSIGLPWRTGAGRTWCWHTVMGHQPHAHRPGSGDPFPGH
ncbi:MAG: hypothetical protein H6595_09835 [Flavobacteriales bacterium]|nr:hypothetical protein [Flavobacteriales bacterium]MCB9167761.1 hypothetical protein [Flavobacteriales bacterium]